MYERDRYSTARLGPLDYRSSQTVASGCFSLYPLVAKMAALLSEYAFGWSIHQLAPFLDKAFGVAGAMDHRMIDRHYDWWVRLPLALLAIKSPTRGILLAGHIVNILAWFDRMPAVWDYMCWCALLESTFVGAALLASTSTELSRRFLPAVRAQLIVLYFSAAFWKLTTSWFDTHYSCATVLMSELLAGLEPLLPPLSHLAYPMLIGAPALVAGIEFAVPTLLVLRPRWGVLLALVFHQTINLMPATYAGGFSLAMCARLLVFLPGCTKSVREAKLPLSSAALVALATAFMASIHGGLDFHGGIYLLLALFYFLTISAPPPTPALATLPRPAKFALAKMIAVVALCVYGSYTSIALAVAAMCSWAPLAPAVFVRRSFPGLAGTAVAVGFFYGFLHPVIGLQMMASSTMYGNVKNYAGSNHLLVPTGLLQDLFGGASAVTYAPGLLADFAGGFVRVDYTSSSAFLQLAVNGADTTDELPPRAHQLLRSVNASGRYFQFYAARNYYDRPGDLQACALNDVSSSGGRKKKADPAYVIPAYELRRALALARERSEAFSLKYTPLPLALRTPSQWKAYVGAAVVLKESGGGARSKCMVVQPRTVWPFGRGACADNELVLQPPPRWWLTKLLIPYPIPLLEGAGDGVHCST